MRSCSASVAMMEMTTSRIIPQLSKNGSWKLRQPTPQSSSCWRRLSVFRTPSRLRGGLFDLTSHDSDEFWGVLFLGLVLIHPMDWEAGQAEEEGCLERQAHSHSGGRKIGVNVGGIGGYGIGKKGGLCGRVHQAWQRDENHRSRR
jgi:hypothetical protein